MLEEARMLVRYTQWANHRLYAALAQLAEEERAKPRPTVFGSLLGTLDHSLVIALVFQAHLLGRPHGFQARRSASLPSLAALWRRQREVDQWFIDYSDVLTPEQWRQLVDFSFIGGGEGRMTRGRMLLHVINHTTFHRGFVADLFCQIPAVPPVTDLTVFLRDAAPVRADIQAGSPDQSPVWR